MLLLVSEDVGFEGVYWVLWSGWEFEVRGTLSRDVGTSNGLSVSVSKEVK